MIYDNEPTAEAYRGLGLWMFLVIGLVLALCAGVGLYTILAWVVQRGTALHLGVFLLVTLGVLTWLYLLIIRAIALIAPEG